MNKIHPSADCIGTGSPMHPGYILVICFIWQSPFQFLNVCAKNTSLGAVVSQNLDTLVILWLNQSPYLPLWMQTRFLYFEQLPPPSINHPYRVHCFSKQICLYVLPFYFCIILSCLLIFHLLMLVLYCIVIHLTSLMFCNSLKNEIKINK